MSEISQTDQRLAARYDGAAAGWHQKISGIGFPAAYRQLVGQALPANCVSNVIDIGTGAGDFALAFLAMRPAPQKLTLLDISSEMLTIASQRIASLTSNYVTHLGPIDSTISQYFDVALCAHMIEHCPTPVRTLSIIHDQLAPGGKILLAVSKPHWCTSIIRLIWRSKAFTPKQVTKMLADAGFSCIHHHPFSNGAPKRVSAGYSATKI